MPKEQVTIRTRDGDCPCHVVTPARGGKFPGVIFFMDAGGGRVPPRGVGAVGK